MTQIKCTACDAPLLWAVTMTGRRQPLDETPDPVRGNIRVLLDGRCETLAGVDLEIAREAGVPLRTSHFATCEFADTFRRKKKAGGTS